ncbi:MAG: hypothetical protein CFH34_00431 [Alphaproteobacteria bacterium MarineAlpha9_Bin4]|nr:hypothetical protein [Pelagibacterales bacterium]PPR27154.1 MAG: hypothetical protein CFH34_00431 [Alphaproteobacteria bacterium MarineAlpha9_Bin4]|tara:strand:- start:1653 stop:2162 length:510 start_codon:yes stop_codon:yes gene_type:complete
MDDSVIKVLRRNGSWEKSNKKSEDVNFSNKEKSDNKSLEDDFKLDEKFEILAQEIKKRMNNKSSFEKSQRDFKKNDNSKNSFITDKSDLENIDRLKIKILPYLKSLEKLISERQSHLENISEIDKELDIIYKDISNIKNDYLNTINKLKQNMNFFDDSLEIIKYAKEEK